jgi:hypothetical protein
MKSILSLAIALLLTGAVYTQPRPVEKDTAPGQVMPTQAEAKYEGGIYGSMGRQKGTLKLDDAGQRVFFVRKEDGREMFSIPYEALIVVYPDSKVSTSQTGNVVSRLPLPGAGLAGLINSRSKYMIINFDDPDIEAKGTANFKFDDQKAMINFIHSLGTKAKMKQRGDAYYRAKNAIF